jgi:hypothetical protein
MATTVQEICDAARDIVLGHPQGIRFSEIVKGVRARYRDAMANTVNTVVASRLVDMYPALIAKPSRGLYQPLTGAVSAPPLPSTTLSEKDVYSPFANWLKNDLEEATEAAALGGASMRAKWATPDVVGVYKPLASQLIKFTPEIVSAEIKVDPTQSVVAFGQAVAYRLFSTRTYVVMPASIGEEDQSRLDALCLLFGIGFVLFDSTSKELEFQIRTRAQRFTPDAFYVNEFASRLHAIDPVVFQKLFG